MIVMFESAFIIFSRHDLYMSSLEDFRTVSYTEPCRESAANELYLFLFLHESIKFTFLIDSSHDNQPPLNAPSLILPNEHLLPVTHIK